ncbi:MAG: DinB family protein [Flavisolibacter sp.]
MNPEIQKIIEKNKDVFEGNPWFGRNAKELLNEVDESIAFEKPTGQHSILELLWHMNIWKEFTISRLRPDNKKNLEYFDKNDWQVLDHSDKKLWKQGVDRFNELHKELLYFMGQQKDDLLSQTVSEKKYDFRKLLYGTIDHDIYHLGQIAYLRKLLAEN